MKKIIFTVLICLIGISINCNNDNSTDVLELKSTAEIIGQDIALCLCCGDWIIKIDNEQNNYQFISLPQDSNIDLQNATFPVSVKLNWSFDKNSSCSNHIIINKIELN